MLGLDKQTEFDQKSPGVVSILFSISWYCEGQKYWVEKEQTTRRYLRNKQMFQLNLSFIK